MTIFKLGSCLVVAAAAFITGCGKQARIEAGQLAKVLADQRATYAAADAHESELVNNARAWCGGITKSGAGRGDELGQNAAVASALAKSAIAASAELGQVRHAMDAQSFKEEYPQTLRNDLITQLTQRQRRLQDIRALLEESATQFLEFRKDKTYVGDTYPDGIGKLDTMLQNYKEPADAVGAVLAELKAKYDLGG